MRKTILLFLFIVFLIACHQRSGNIQPDIPFSASEDLKRDSLRTDSLALIAFKDALFGMTLEELKNTRVFQDAEPNSEGVLRGTYEGGTIGITSFVIYGYLCNGVLCKVVLETNYMTANYINPVLIKGANVLKDYFEQQYGALKVYNSKPSVNEIEAGSGVLMYAGSVGGKTIMISIDEKTSGAQYKMVCEITHSTFRGY